ncbi:MAG: T9SS type B sorting domain-containing protein [Paludibacter sp.]
MKSTFFYKSFNSCIVNVCFTFFLILLNPLKGFSQPMSVSGNVYIDADGSVGLNKVDGVGVGIVDGNQLYAILVDNGTGLTETATAIAMNGSYSFFRAATFSFSVFISTTNYTSGTTPFASLPSGWMFSGEINNDASNSLTGNDGTADGEVINVPGANETNINFGIGQIVSPPTVTPGGPDNTCQSVTPVAITLNGASVGGSATTGTWSITSGGGSLSTTAQTATPAIVTYTPAANFTGVVTLTLTSDGSPKATGTRTINVNPLPSSSITASNEACVGSSIVYTILAGMNNYVWTVSSGGTITSGGGSTDNTVTVSWNTAGTENVSVNFTNGNGCTASDSRNVPVKALPTCSITGPDGPIAPSSSSNIYTAPAGKSYVWSISGNATIVGSTTSQSVSVTVGASCGVSFTLSLEITDLPGPVLSCSSICNKVVTVSTNSISAITGTTTVCVGSNTQLTDLTSGGTWSSGSTGIATINASSGLVTGVSAGTSLITYAVTNVCGTTSVTSTITVNPLPTVAAITGSTNVCVGSTTQLANTTSFGSWSSNSPGVATVSAGGAGGPGGLVTGISEGTSLITYTINNGSCSKSVSQLVTVTTIPTISGTTPGSVCGTGTVTLSATAFFGTINWYDSLTGGNLVGSGSSFTTPVISATTTYYVDATNNGCTTASRTAVVATVNTLPTTPIITSVTQPSCAVGTGTITVTLQNATDTYSFDNGVTFQAGNIKSGLVPGNYHVIIKSIGGCNSVVTSVILVAPTCNNIDLVVVETVNASTVTIGQTVIFSIVATNNGPDNATGTSVDVKLPSGFTFVSTSNTIGTYDPITGLWTIGNMINGATETLTITATVNANGSYTMTAVIKCDEVEATLINNTSTAELVPFEFFIPDAFTPNRDGFNDLFEIRHPVNTKIEIEIFNRWGNSVYKSSDYQNDWDGKGTGNFLGKDLPDGTYYCSYKELNASSGEIVLKGLKYITLRR